MTMAVLLKRSLCFVKNVLLLGCLDLSLASQPEKVFSKLSQGWREAIQKALLDYRSEISTFNMEGLIALI